MIIVSAVFNWHYLKPTALNLSIPLKVEREFYYTVDAHLALLSNKFNFNYSIFGIHGEGYFHAFYKDYNFQPGFKDNFLEVGSYKN